MEQKIYQKIMEQYQDNIIAFNGRPMKVQLEAHERYMLLPDYFLIQGNDVKDRSIINMKNIKDGSLIKMIESEHDKLMLIPDINSLLIYNGENIHYCTSWSKTWDTLLGTSKFEQYRI